jgi:hypothetical protein
MATDDRLTNLMFLLSFSPLAVGCSVGGVSTTTSSGPVVDPTTGGDDDDDDDDTASATASAETSAADTSTSGVVDEGPSMTEDDGPYMTDGGTYMETGDYECMGMPPMGVGMIGPLCMQYVGHYNDCFYGGMQAPYCVAIYEAMCQSYVDTSYMMYGPYCAMAIEEAFTCITQIPCPQLMDMTDDCVQEFMFLGQACAPD